MVDSTLHREHYGNMSEKIWLASFPRSGNTLVRLILGKCFDIVAGSKYPENGEADLAAPIIKTHDHAEDDAPAIVLVRDGRAALVSYWHFFRDYDEPVALSELIQGSIGFGSWSAHFRSWEPMNRPDRLLLRFEDFSADPECAIEALATFLGKRPVSPFDATFDKLNANHPKFFRSGDNAANIAELVGDDLELFKVHHGELMTELGYWSAQEAACRSIPVANAPPAPSVETSSS